MISIKVDRKGLCDILSVKERTLKDIEKEGKLQIRLKEKGYIFIAKLKEGRKNIYEIEQENEYKEIYSNLVKNYYNTNKEIEFTKYFNLRTLTNDLFPLNKADISNKVNVSSRTITRWDNTLLDKSIIAKDGFYYFCLDKNKGAIKQCSKEEYKSFWKNKAIENHIKVLIDKYYKGEIGIEEMLKENSNFTTKINLFDNKYYFRTKKYKTNTENQLYIDTYNLIQSVYGNDTEYKPVFEIINIDISELELIKDIKFKKLNTYKEMKVNIKKIKN